jgi:hypothetical protein
MQPMRHARPMAWLIALGLLASLAGAARGVSGGIAVAGTTVYYLARDPAGADLEVFRLDAAAAFDAATTLPARSRIRVA